MLRLSSPMMKPSTKKWQPRSKIRENRETQWSFPVFAFAALDEAMKLCYDVAARRCGGTGRHKGLKIPRRKKRTGSIPVSGTNKSHSECYHSLWDLLFHS